MNSQNLFLIKRLVPYFRPYWLRLLQASLSMTGVAIFTTGSVWLIRSTVDGAFLGKDLQKLFIISVSLPILYLVKGIFIYLQNYLMKSISFSIVRDIRSQVYAHLQSLSSEYYHNTSTGQLISRLTNDTTLLQASIGRIPIQVIRDGLTLLFLIGTLFYLHWKFAIFTLMILPFAAIPIIILGKKLRRSSKEIQHHMASLSKIIQDGISGNLITKIFSKESDEIKRFNKKNESYYKETLRWIRADALGTPIMEFLGSLAALFLLWFGGKDVIHGVWTAGSFFTFLGASVAAYKPIKEITKVNAQIQQSLACSERIFELLNEKPSLKEISQPMLLDSFKEEIHYDSVSFKYQEKSPDWILQNINLKIKKGEIIGLVGHSGSGKTTLVHLLPRLFDPTSGTLKIDGVPIQNASLNSLRKQIGVVTQDTLLFDETVRYNITYSREASDLITQEEIEQATTIANAHSFITELENGYDTVVGEKGVRLSGGQKQRLSIARAILKNPPILILDEATSALDSKSERLVQMALERLMENRTVLVIAHRLSTIQKADKIIVLEKGEIIQRGTHQMLLEQGGLYKKLYETELS